MSDSHLSPDQIERCLHFTLTPEEIPNVYAHLDHCAECRSQVATHRETPLTFTRVETALLWNESQDREVLSNEQIAAYVDDSLTPEEREWVDVYLERSAIARLEMRQAQSVRNLLASLPPLEAAPLAHVLLRDTDSPILQDTEGHISSTGWMGLPDILKAWAYAVVTQGIASPIVSVREALESMHRIAVPTLRRGSPVPDPLSPTFTAVRAMPLLFRWQSVPNAQEYVVILTRQTDATHRTIVWKRSAGLQTEIALAAEITLEPKSAYVWQVTANVAGLSMRSPFAWFLTLSEADLQAFLADEQTCGTSLVARIGVLEAYGFYEEALAQVAALAELNPDNPIVGAVRAQLQQRFEHSRDAE